MSQPIEASNSWRGLFGCLGTGMLAVALIVAVVLHVRGRQDAVEQRIMAEFIQPYLQTLRSGDPRSAWHRFTTTTYRERHSLETYSANFHTALEQLGRPKDITITHCVPTYEPGRSYQDTVTHWVMENGLEFFRTFDLVDVPGEGFKVDAATLGGRHHSVTPSEVPPDPW